jgi:F-type H+-transporting ATPase subunit epsilon
MKVVIAKVDQIYFDGEAQSLTAPGRDGVLTVLHNHEPLITTLQSGAITVRAKDLPGGEQQFPIESGILEVNRDGATVIL